MPDIVSPRFAACLETVLALEGGYVDHPKDPGGATNLGVTRKTLARWRKISPWWGLDKAEVKALGKDEAGRIYRALYWDSSGAGTLPAGIDLALFDFAVNSGPDRAVKTLQRAVGVVADGRIGPLSLAAIKLQVGKAGAAALIDALCEKRLNFLQQLAAYATFGRGWRNRVATIRKAALAAAGISPLTPLSTRSTAMDVLSGYRTYIVAAAMVVAGLAQMLGVDLPVMDTHSAGQLILEAFAIIFLRKGIKGDISSA